MLAENSPSNTGFESETFQAENTTTLDSVCARAQVVLTYIKVLCTSVSSILFIFVQALAQDTEPHPAAAALDMSHGVASVHISDRPSAVAASTGRVRASPAVVKSI